MKLSIVIPVFNVEKYVRKCIDSCVDQNCLDEEYEIIIINDGSTDNSLSLVCDNLKYHSNIKVLSQDNMGLGATRNRGIEESLGDYIWFVDSDDWIEKNILKQVFLAIDKCADVVQIPFITAFDNRKGTVFMPPTCYANPKKNISSKMIFPAQFYIVRRKFMLDNQIRFTERILHEDIEYTPRILYLAKSILFFDQPAYYFYKRPYSITTTYTIERSFSYLKVASNLHDFSLSFPQEYYCIFSSIIALSINNALYNALRVSSMSIRTFNDLLPRYSFLFYRMFYSRSVKYIIEGVLFLLFPQFIIRIYKVLKKL